MATVRIPAPKSVQFPEIRLPLNFLSGGGIRPAVAGLAEGAEAGTPAAGAETQPQETVGVSTQPEHAHWGWVIISYVLIIAGGWIGTALAKNASKIEFTPIDGIGLLALFFVMAQALERLMEPLAELQLPGFGSSKNKSKDQRDQAIVKALNETDPKKKQENATGAANADAEAKKIQANTKVFIWAVGSLIAMLVCGAGRLFFLDALGASGVPDLINVMVTGLVVGSGTKPLHEFVKLLEKKNEETSDSGDGADNTNT